MTKEAKDISDELVDPVVKIRESNTKGDNEGKLDVADGESLAFEISFVTPKGTRDGDTVTITHSDNFGLKGLEPVPTNLLDITFGDTVIAKGMYYEKENKIVYTFTDAINNRDYAKARAEHAAFDREEKIVNNQEQTFTVNMGKTSDSITLNVDYGAPYEHEGLEGKSEFTEWNPETGEFTQIYYINPNSKDVNYSSLGDLQRSIGVILHNENDKNESKSDVFFTEDNTKVTVYKLPKGYEMPDAVYEEWLKEENIDPDTKVDFNNENGKARVNFNKQKIDNPYVIKVVSKVDPSKENINLFSAANFYGNDGNYTTDPTWLELNNSILTVNSTAGGEFPDPVNGTFEELHVYEEYENGELVNTTAISVPVVEGTEDQTFTTSAKPEGTKEDPKEGFKLVPERIENLKK